MKDDEKYKEFEAAEHIDEGDMVQVTGEGKVRKNDADAMFYRVMPDMENLPRLKKQELVTCQ